MSLCPDCTIKPPPGAMIVCPDAEKRQAGEPCPRTAEHRKWAWEKLQAEAKARKMRKIELAIQKKALEGGLY